MAGAASVSPAALEHRHQQVDPDATVLTLYTSGTTGFPKGVMHSHNIQRTVIDAGSRMGITPRDVILMYLPLFHVFGLYEGLADVRRDRGQDGPDHAFDPGGSLALDRAGRGHHPQRLRHPLSCPHHAP